MVRTVLRLTSHKKTLTVGRVKPAPHARSGAAKEISTLASGSGTSRRKSLSMASSMKWITPVAPVTDLNAAAQLLRLAAFSMLRLFCGGR